MSELTSPEDVIKSDWKEERDALEHREEELKTRARRSEDALESLQDIVNRRRDSFSEQGAWLTDSGVFRALRRCDEQVSGFQKELTHVRSEMDDCDAKYKSRLQKARGEAKSES